MDIQVIQESSDMDFKRNVSYKFMQLKSGKYSCDVLMFDNHNDDDGYINVTVNNASHKAYRGMGKQFDTPQQAVDNYKTEAIKAMIRYATGLK